MTYLELVQDLHRKAGAGGAVPSSIVNASGEALDLVQYIRDADLYVQSIWADWKFLWRDDFSVATETGINVIQRSAAPVTVGMWDSQTFRLDGDELPCKEWAEVRRERFHILPADYAKPSRVIILPDRNLRLDPVPDDEYLLTAEYFRAPVTMTQENASESVVPTEGHILIVARALLSYGEYNSAQDAIDQAMQLWGDFFPMFESAFSYNIDRAHNRMSQGEPLQMSVEDEY